MKTKISSKMVALTLIMFLALVSIGLTGFATHTAFAASSVTLSPDNEFSANVPKFSSKNEINVALEGVTTGDYILYVLPYGDPEEEYPAYTISAQLNGGAITPLEENPYMYGAYTAKFSISASVANSFKITTSSEKDLTVDISLYPVVTPQKLPVGAEHATLKLWEATTFSYESAYTGYYTISVDAPAGADLDITLKHDPSDLTGTALAWGSYPINLVAGETYYFDVVYSGSATGAETIDVTFSFAEWEKPTLALNALDIYIPVTPSNTPVVNIDIDSSSLEAGNYVLALTLLPVSSEGLTVQAIIDSNEPVDLDQENNFNAVIQLSSASKQLHLTSNWSEVFVVGVTLSYTPAEEVNIPLNTPTSITVRPNESITCYAKGITQDGNYNLVLSGYEAATSKISVSNLYDDVIIANGETSGIFAVMLMYPEPGYPGEQSKDEPLIFQNKGTSSVTVTATISAIEGTDYDITLGTAKQISVAPQGKSYYYVKGLASGSYLISLSVEGNDIAVYNYFNTYSPLIARGADQGMYSFSLVGPFENEDGTSYPGETSRTLCLVVQNSASSEKSCSITVTKVNSLELGVNENITVMGTANYYIGNLTTGRYEVALSNIPAGAVLLNVLYNGDIIASRTDPTGVIEVDVPNGQATTIAMISITYVGASAPFNISITEIADGTMSLGVAQTVTLGYNDATETYNIQLEAGKYTLSISGDIPSGVTVFVMVNGEYVLYGEYSGTFNLAEDATVAVVFSYSYYEEHPVDETTISFSFEAIIAKA